MPNPPPASTAGPEAGAGHAPAVSVQPAVQPEEQPNVGNIGSHSPTVSTGHDVQELWWQDDCSAEPWHQEQEEQARRQHSVDSEQQPHSASLARVQQASEAPSVGSGASGLALSQAFGGQQDSQDHRHPHAGCSNEEQPVLPGSSCHQEQQQVPSRPMFFARFTAGWVHASLGTVAVSLLEKQRQYADAVELLQLLLGGNACPARRGTWWARLSINLEHLKQVSAAMALGCEA